MFVYFASVVHLFIKRVRLKMPVSGLNNRTIVFQVLRPGLVEVLMVGPNGEGREGLAEWRILGGERPNRKAEAWGNGCIALGVG
jgi:hypothetical protein